MRHEEKTRRSIRIGLRVAIVSGIIAEICFAIVLYLIVAESPWTAGVLFFAAVLFGFIFSYLVQSLRRAA